jgi:zinc/manganese transport system substrate-binding protein
VPFLPAPFDQPYLLRALLELALLAPIAGALGVLVVLRRQVFTAHAIGVGSLPGVVLAVTVGIPVLLGGVVAGGLLALGALRLGADARRGDPSTTTGVLLAGAIGVGALLISAGVGGSGARIDGLLFGTLIGITDADLVRAAIIFTVTVIALLGLGRVWAFAAFDPSAARAAGLRPGRLDLLVAVLLALVIVFAVEAVGAVLASALVVLPAAAALRLTRRIPSAMLLAAVFGLIAGTAGVLIADRWSLPSGVAVVLAAAALWPLAAGIAYVRTHRRRSLAGLALASVAILAACGGGSGTTAESTGSDTTAGSVPVAGALSVVATTPIVADWVKAVGGDDVTVTTIIPAGVETHDFEPTPEAARAVDGAAVVFSSGAGLDEWADQLVEAAGSGVTLVELAPENSLAAPAEEPGHAADADDHGHAADAPADEPAADAHGHGDVDPHYWHDPTLVQQSVAAIAAALATADPAHAAAYEERATAYEAELAALDQELAAAVAGVPADRRLLVTDHDAFSYLGRHYDIELIGAAIPSTSGAASADAKTMAELIDVIKERGVPAVFSESTADPAVAKVLADEAGVPVIDGLFADTLAPAGDAAGTYIGMMRSNVLLIAEGLKG